MHPCAGAPRGGRLFGLLPGQRHAGRHHQRQPVAGEAGGGGWGGGHIVAVALPRLPNMWCQLSCKPCVQPPAGVLQMLQTPVCPTLPTCCLPHTAHLPATRRFGSLRAIPRWATHVTGSWGPFRCGTAPVGAVIKTAPSGARDAPAELLRGARSYHWLVIRLLLLPCSSCQDCLGIMAKTQPAVSVILGLLLLTMLLHLCSRTRRTAWRTSCWGSGARRPWTTRSGHWPPSRRSCASCLWVSQWGCLCVCRMGSSG